MGYLLADWAATLALGVLSNSKDDDSTIACKDPNLSLNNGIVAFWSPFLLLHLGGPDSITAFSLEDNELWLRHLLGLVFQASVAVYIIIRSLPNTKFLPATVLMFGAGIIKYGERTWALMSASRENFRDSMVPPPDPGPNYAKFMEEYSWKTNAGINAKIIWDNELESQMTFAPRPTVKENIKDIEGVELIFKAHEFFEVFKRLIVDLILTFQDRNQSQSFFINHSWKQAFDLIEIELELVYEVLFTKAAAIHSLEGHILRLFSITSIFSSFVMFCLVEKHLYSETNVVITYVLLVGAVILEMWSLIRLVFCNWSIVWMEARRRNKLSSYLFQVVSYRHSKVWSNSMAQYDLVNFCLNDRPPFILKFKRFGRFKEMYDKFYYRTCTEVTPDLKCFIFDDLKKKLNDAHGTDSYKYFSASRGKLALQILEGTNYFSVEVEFDESILRWHIATDICHNLDREEHLSEMDDEVIRNVNRSMVVSRYMLYLLVSRTFMLPSGIGQVRYGDTCAEAKSFFYREIAEIKERSLKIELHVGSEQFPHMSIDACRAYRKLFGVNSDVPPKQVKGDTSKSVLFDASRLAKSLRKLDLKKRWVFISHLWVEILYFAASNCRGNYHAQRLSAGGELLTIVWFLMAHLGIGKQYRVEAGHGRAKVTAQ
ncbi:hypothetical protein GIB67_005433 [Kingdonia uniflora]|uniref:DUF4220 domain-containing protein n=1 Tax=Kingdonia uniflora TaxID=39325 RepID=A0A7J7NH53_9MAGN|nr:hypothetical protein GIB67_005433 [Kingdonia uniflora]